MGSFNWLAIETNWCIYFKIRAGKRETLSSIPAGVEAVKRSCLTDEREQTHNSMITITPCATTSLAHTELENHLSRRRKRALLWENSMM